MRTQMTNKQWAAKYPDAGTSPVSAEPCVSPEFFELERERIFRRHWLNVGRVDDVPAPGDYFVRDLVVCRVSVLIMRGTDGEVRAFHNVCSHRGNKLVWQAKGRCPGRLACGFHNWAYDADGCLAYVPDEENFHGLDKGEHGLTPIACAVWEGFVFVHLDGEPRMSLPEYLGGVAAQLANCPFGNMQRLRTYLVDERANWKVGLDAQNEVYHLPFQHRYTFPDAFVLKDRRFTRFMNVNLYDYHSVWSCEYNPEHRQAPTEALLNRLDRATNNVRMPQMIGDFDFFVIFPNMVILLFKGVATDFYVTYNFWPLALDHTQWEIRFHFPPAETLGQRLTQEWMICRLRDTLMEDAKAHESIHQGLASRAKKVLLLQDEEITIRHFHHMVERAVGSCGAVR
jgi:phenylpropionate dioxygenase-like ring-hydroxylating dioxygenase large terminal subunit